MGRPRTNWKPDEDELEKIVRLTEIGWGQAQIAYKFRISVDMFKKCLEDYPRIKQLLDEAEAFRKENKITRMEWHPEPEDFKIIKEHAAKGLTPAAIASKLGVPRAAFKARLEDCPELIDAFEIGNGLYQGELIEDTNELVEERSEDLKAVGSMLIFKLKAYCGLGDKPAAPPTSTVKVEGEIKHKHELRTPAVVATPQIADYAKQEMARAGQISAHKLQLVQQPDPIEVEAVSDD